MNVRKAKGQSSILQLYYVRKFKFFSSVTHWDARDSLVQQWEFSASVLIEVHLLRVDNTIILRNSL